MVHEENKTKLKTVVLNLFVVYKLLLMAWKKDLYKTLPVCSKYWDIWKNFGLIIYIFRETQAMHVNVFV